MRFSLFTFDRVHAVEAAASLWLRCRQLLNGNPQEHGVRSFADATRFVKAAMTSNQNDLIPLLELASSVVPADLRSALGYLLAQNVELQIAAPSHGCTVMKHTPASERSPAARRWSPDGIWEPSPTLRASEFSHGAIPRALLDDVITNARDTFYVKELSTMADDKPIVLSYQPYVKTSLHQLLVRRALPEGVHAGLRSFLHGTAASSRSPATPSKPASKLLSAEIDAFCTKKSDVTGSDRRNRAWTPKTLMENRAIYSVFLEVIGDKPVLEITNDDYDRYMSALKRLPPNRNKSPKYRGMSVTEILELPRTPDMKVCEPHTVEKAHSAVCQLVRFIAKRQPAGQMNTSITDELRITKSTRAALLQKKRQPFSNEQLSLMFESERAMTFFRERKRPHPYQVWLPPIALYTGARIGEISQLALTDFGTENGTAYFDIRFAEDDDEDGESVKTVNSDRRIPIHPALLDLGLLEFVTFMRSQHPKKTEGRLFPELKNFQGKGYGKESGRWFNSKFLTEIGIKARGVVFHCFRHTVSGVLIRADVPPWRISRYFGHAPGKDAPESIQSYLNERKIEDVAPVIAALNFPINWSAYKALTQETYRPARRSHSPRP